MEDLVAKDMMDVDGVIEVSDKPKYRPVVAIEEDCEEVDLEFS